MAHSHPARRPPGKLLGSETIEQIIAQTSQPASPRRGCKSLLIGCSANYNDPAVRQGFLQVGAAMCWPKPLPDLATIRAQLREQLPGRLPGQVRVLVVDDNRINRKMIQRTLASLAAASWSFEGASSASEALQSMGFDWRQPKYSDQRSKRDVIKYERCDSSSHRTMDSTQPRCSQ